MRSHSFPPSETKIARCAPRVRTHKRKQCPKLALLCISPRWPDLRPKQGRVLNGLRGAADHRPTCGTKKVYQNSLSRRPYRRTNGPTIRSSRIGQRLFADQEQNFSSSVPQTHFKRALAVPSSWPQSNTCGPQPPTSSLPLRITKMMPRYPASKCVARFHTTRPHRAVVKREGLQSR